MDGLVDEWINDVISEVAIKNSGSFRSLDILPFSSARFHKYFQNPILLSAESGDENFPTSVS